MKKTLTKILSTLLCVCIIGGCTAVFTPSVSAISKNESTVADFLFKQMKLNSAAVSGILANIEWESGFDPSCVGDHGTSYGICQWHESRWDRMKEYCNKNKYNWKTLDGQLRYLKYELEQFYPDILKYIKGVANTESGAYDAAYYWCKYFERPADLEALSVKRGNLAKTKYWVVYQNSYNTINEGAYRFKSVSADLYLSVKDSGDSNGQNVELSSATGAATVFDVNMVVNTVYSIKASCSKSGRMVNIYADVVQSGKNVTLYDNTEDNSQQWYFQKLSDGYVIRSAADHNLALTVSGNNVIVSTYTGAASQKWQLCNISGYTVQFNANGGTGAPAAQAKKHGVGIALPMTEPKRTGYVFRGWALSAKATTAVYYPGDPFCENGDFTLYAVWQTEPCEGAGGTGHKWSFRNVTKGPTCTEDGMGNYYCSKCNQTSELPLFEENICTEWSESKPEGYPEETIQEKTMYRYAKTDAGTKKTGEGTIQSAVFPQGFDKTNSLYQKYNNSVSDTATRKYSGDEKLVGYIYWHWCCSSYSASVKVPSNLYISENKGNEDGRTYDVFHAFFDSTYYAFDTVKKGTKIEKASVCGTVYWWQEAIPVYEYKYTDYSSATGEYSPWQDTPVTAGGGIIVQQKTFYRCDLHALGHKYKASDITPTCTADGYTKHSCIRCEEYYIDSIISASENAAHDFSQKIVTPTCTTDGYTEHTCQNCGFSYIDGIISAVGHEYKSGVCVKCKSPQ